MVQSDYMLAGEIRKVMQRELGQFGLTVFVTQCSELNIRPEEIKVGDLLRLSQAVIRAVRPSAGDEKAQRVGKEIQKLKVKTELEAMREREREPGSQRRLAELQVTLGNLCLATGSYHEGIKAFDRAKGYAKDSDYKLKLAEAYIGIGLIKEKESKWDEAIEALNRGLRLSEDIDYPLGIADASRWIGHLEWHKSEYEDALRWLDKSLDNAKRTGDDGIVGAAMIEYGLVYSDIGDLDKAIEWFEKSIELVNNVRDNKQVARVYNNIGDSYMQLEQWDRAIEYFDKCKEHASMINSQEFIGWSLFNSAEALVNIGEVDEALERANGALDILEAIGEPLGLQGTFRILGLIHANMKKWDEADAYFQKARDVMLGLDAPYNEAQVYMDWGLMYKKKGTKKKAKELLTRAKGLLEGIGAKALKDRVEEALSDL